MIKNKTILISLLLGGLTSIGFAESNNSMEMNSSQEKNTSTELHVEKKVTQTPSTPSSMEEQIQKALLGISSLKVLKEGESKIVFESEAMVLEQDKPKTIKKPKKKRTTHKRVIRKKEPSIDMDNLPMAKTYPMDYELSKIKE